jgi:hypothetical protein
MNRKVLIAVGGVVLVLVVFIWQVVANLDSIVAGVVEDIGSDVLKTETSVSGMAINLKEGKVGIAGLTIANPDGYSRANLFEMEGIEVDLALNSLSDDVLVIEAILIHNPIINFEGDESGGSNMQTLLNNMESGSSDDGAADSEETRIIIDRFEFSGGLVKASSPAKPGEVTDIKLPGIKMSGIGRKQGGVTPDIAVEKITNELLNEIIAAAARAGVNKVIEEKKKGFLDKLKGES